MRTALRQHWPEYLIEAAGLGLFMLSAALFATLLEHPASPARAAISDPWLRRLLMGLAMGSTAALLVYSRWGKRSGAHFNPAFTLGFLRLAKVARWDAAFYVAAQFAGGVAGLALARVALAGALAAPPVNSVATVPGPHGVAAAFAAEALISFVLMLVALVVMNRPRINRYTGLVIAALLVLYITFEAPWSGMSLNPARSFASALVGGVWTDLWIYFAAPTLGMLAAVELYRRAPGSHRALCAKIHHDNHERCIFACGYPRDEHEAPHA